MPDDITKQYQEQIDRGLRCRDWYGLESTQEFLKPLREKLVKAKSFTYDDLKDLDDRTFRSKVEADLLFVKEVEDFFQTIEETIEGVAVAVQALQGVSEDYS